MLRFAYSKYSLKSLTRAGGLPHIQDRDGAIFRITWPNGKIGYADIMIKPELGDRGLQHELEELRNLRMSNLTEQMISLAKTDADDRFVKKNSFTLAKKVKNNFFISEPLKMDFKILEQIKKQNFFSLMIDCGQDFQAEVEVIRKILKLSQFVVRLDFNAKADFSTFERFLTSIEPGLRPRIEYVEDPMPFEPLAWKEAAKIAPLAVESQYNLIKWEDPKTIPPLKAVVIRPSRIDVQKAVKNAIQNKMKVVITSSLEHPIGIAHATKVASDLIAKDPLILMDHDCLYQTFYAPHQFSGILMSQGPYIVTSEGYGIGFDRKLKELFWTDV